MFHTWVSIRQAFLDLDKDHDGFIKAKDLLFVFGDNQLDFVYLKKLMNDLTKEGKRGYMSYKEFS